MMEAPTTAPAPTDSSNSEKQKKAAAAQAKVAASLRDCLGAWHRSAAATAAVPAPAGKQQAKGKQGKASAAATKAKAPTAGSKSKKVGPKDPKDEALAKLMQDLDEKVNKAKKCKLEDMYSAVAALDDKEQQVLASILSAYSSKVLGEKGGNEASMSLRDSLCAAAAAHSFRSPQQHPEASKTSAATFRQQGLPACSTLEAGFTAGQLLRGGYSPAELVQSGVPLAKLRAAGISVADLYSHLPADEAAQLSGIAGAAALRASGYPPAAVQEGAAAGAFSSWDLKLAGYPVTITSSSPAPPAAAGGSNFSSPRSRFSLPAAVLKQQHSVQQPERSSQQDGLGPSDVQYFRHQIAQLVQMQPGVDVPPLLLCGSAKTPSSQFAAAAASPASMTARISSSASRGRVPRIKWQQLGPAAEASTAAPHKHQQQQHQQLEEAAAAEDSGAVAEI